MLVTCFCANIRVHARGEKLKSKDVSSLFLPKIVKEDSFFEEHVYQVDLDFAGVSFSQKLLCKVREVDNYAFITCGCCDFEMYSKLISNDDQVLLSPKAVSDSALVTNIMDSDKYSNLFRLVLPEINDNFIQANMGIGLQNKNIQNSIEVTQSEVSSYLRTEQKAMEDRIREFTLLEQSKYNSLLTKVRKNKQAMIYLLYKCQEHATESKPEALGESSAVVSSINPDCAAASSSIDSAFEKSDAHEQPTEEVKKENIKVLRRALSTPTRSKSKVKRQLKRAPASIDVGGVFEMDELEIGDALSSFSDDYTDESDNEAKVNCDKKEEIHVYGTSVPMSIPTPAVPRNPVADVEEKEEYVPIKHEDIAESMRALACSVHDGTEMFGELPRRRLNTGDLLASRPF